MSHDKQPSAPPSEDKSPSAPPSAVGMFAAQSTASSTQVVAEPLADDLFNPHRITPEKVTNAPDIEHSLALPGVIAIRKDYSVTINPDSVKYDYNKTPIKTLILGDAKQKSAFTQALGSENENSYISTIGIDFITHFSQHAQFQIWNLSEQRFSNQVDRVYFSKASLVLCFGHSIQDMQDRIPSEQQDAFNYYLISCTHTGLFEPITLHNKEAVAHVVPKYVEPKNASLFLDSIATDPELAIVETKSQNPENESSSWWGMS